MATRTRAQRVAAMAQSISGFGNKARQAASQYKASPRSVSGNLQPAQFNAFQKPAKTMMDVYPWSGGKHRAATSAQSASKNARYTSQFDWFSKSAYQGKHRSGVEQDTGMADYI